MTEMNITRRMLMCGLLLTVGAARPVKAPDAAAAAAPRAQHAGTQAESKSPGFKTYENAEHKFRFKAPGSWSTASGGPPGSVYNLAIPPDSSSLPKFKPGEGVVHIFGDLFTIVVTPAKTPTDDLAAATADVEEQVKAHFRNAEFKPPEKTKFAGLDATVLTASMVSDKQGEPKLIHRHIVFQRDGKVFQVALWAHENTVGRDMRLLQNVLKSFEWTAAPTTAPSRTAEPATRPSNAAPPAAKTAKPATGGAGDGLD
jgi:hypothetical protein